MKLETILKVIEIIRRSGEQSKYISGLDKRFFSKKNLLFSFINKRRFFSNKRRFSEFENYDDIMTQYDVIHLYK